MIELNPYMIVVYATIMYRFDPTLVQLNALNWQSLSSVQVMMTSVKPTSMKHEHIPWQLFKRRAKATAFSWASALWSQSPSPAGVPTHGTTALQLNKDTRRMSMSKHAV